jgi:hypothetical protein
VLLIELHGGPEAPSRAAAPKLPVEARTVVEEVGAGGGQGGGEGVRHHRLEPGLQNAAAGLHQPWRALLVACRLMRLQLVVRAGLDAAGVRAVVHDVEEQRVGVGALHVPGGEAGLRVPVRAPEVGPAHV